MNSQGLDYGMGKANVDRKTGIRFGVIRQNGAACEALAESLEPVYSAPVCDVCEGEKEGMGEDDRCESTEDCAGRYHYADEPEGWEFDGDGYQLTDCLQSDVMVIKAPFYTIGSFCSPCVPGAVDLDSAPTEEEYDAEPEKWEGWERGYCLGHDWFEGGKAPYPVWSVETGERVMGEEHKEDGGE